MSIEDTDRYHPADAERGDPNDATQWAHRRLAWERQLRNLRRAADAGAAPAPDQPPGGRERRTPALAWTARWCTDHVGLVVLGWLLVAAALSATTSLWGDHYRTDFRLPGTDSQRAMDMVDAHFPQYRGDRELLVIHARDGEVADPQHRAAISHLLGRLRRVPHVSTVTDPLTGPGAGISRDRRTAVAVVQFRESADDVPTSSVQRVLAATEKARGPLLDVGVLGQATENAAARAPSASEGIALLVAAGVLLVGFGSAAAVAVALCMAGLALTVGLGLMALISHVVAVPTFATQVATTVGLGVGIDYALLVLARYRSAAQSGLAPAAATAHALQTSGRAVLFAGATVIVAMLGLYAVPLPFVHGLAIGVSVVVAPTMAASVTLLPALLGRFGTHLDRWRPPGLRRRQLSGRSRQWARWAVAVQRHPGAAAGAAVGVLVMLAIPAATLRVGNADASTDNAGTPSHRAYTQVTRAFGPGFTSPFAVVVTSEQRALAPSQHSIDIAGAALRQTPGVAAVGPPQPSTVQGQVLYDVYPTSQSSSPDRVQLLRRLRGPVRLALERRGIRTSVGGAGAVNADLARAVTRSLPLVLGAVIGISFLLLLVLFRSVVVAGKAGLMNLLTVAAAFGAVVAVFQWGWGLHLIGVDYAGPIEIFLPLLLFPVVFGLSMDYEVFLVSRMREEWDRSGDNASAVTEGLATTGRIVTAGAIVMAVLFASLVFAHARTVKMFGLAMATAIVLDAVVVRSLLLPATMQLLGRANWWLPGWIDRRLPRWVE